MKIIIGLYTIEITDVIDLASATSNIKLHYIDKSEFKLTTRLLIKVFFELNYLKSVIIGGQGGASAIHETSQIVAENEIVICCSDTVFNLTIPELYLIWKKKVDSITCFEIFKLDRDYIVQDN